MGIMPHTDPDRALELALKLDVPFWPQLPRFNFMEDMYAQACDGLPGFKADMEKKTVTFNYDRFYAEVEEFYNHVDDPEYFGFRPGTSVVFDKFLDRDLSSYWAIRGQMIGFISFGTKVLDENLKPVIFDENVKQVLMTAIALKTNWQLSKLLTKNPRAFVWLDDPGLPLIFMGTSGYVEQQARSDLADTLDKITGAKGIHLCGNPEWDFLLKAGLDILSMDAFSCGETFVNYKSLVTFIETGGVLSWGIVPTQTELFEGLDIRKILEYLDGLWEKLAANGVDKKRIAAQSLIAPATCCLVNPDRDKTVERTFEMVRNVSAELKSRYGF